MENNPNSQYYVLKKRLTYDEISPFLDKEKEVAAEAAEFNKTADSDNQRVSSMVYGLKKSTQEDIPTTHWRVM